MVSYQIHDKPLGERSCGTPTGIESQRAPIRCRLDQGHDGKHSIKLRIWSMTWFLDDESAYVWEMRW